MLYLVVSEIKLWAVELWREILSTVRHASEEILANWVSCGLPEAPLKHSFVQKFIFIGGHSEITENYVENKTILKI